MSRIIAPHETAILRAFYMHPIAPLSQVAAVSGATLNEVLETLDDWHPFPWEPKPPEPEEHARMDRVFAEHPDWPLRVLAQLAGVERRQMQRYRRQVRLKRAAQVHPAAAEPPVVAPALQCGVDKGHQLERKNP